MFRSKLFRSVLLVVVATSTIASAKSIPKIDEYVAKVRATYNVPGIAVGIIKDGEVVHMKGYGIADLDRGNKVDEYTLFKIASNSKAFTAAGLAMQEDQGKLKLTDKVSQHLSDFKMFDSYASEQFNIIDLLTHRSGLGRGAGDLMLWPEPTKFTREQLVHNLRYLKPAYGFREKYAYDNTLYIVAGELSAAVAGSSWEEHIENSIFKPLGMKHCVAGGVDTTKLTNVVAPHLEADGEVYVDQPNRMRKKTNLMAAAGGIKCSIHDLLKWVDVQLRMGTTAEGVQLYSEKLARKMWSPVTPMGISKSSRELDNTHFRGYALGWRSSDFLGHYRVQHTGSLSGVRSYIGLFPDQNLGYIVLINKSSSTARNILTRSIAQEFLDIEKTDWFAYYLEQEQKRKAQRAAQQNIDEGEALPEEVAIKKNRASRKRLGTYQDQWFGNIHLKRQGKDIVFTADNLPRVIGNVYSYDENTWWVKWHNRSFEADSWIRFERVDGKRKMTMARILKDSDWSFSIQDLDFTKVKK